MTSILLVFLGGGIGAVARYGLQGTVYRALGDGFPYGTIVVNIMGCFCIGLLMVVMDERFLVNPSIRIFLTIGVLGGFTTFSSFSYETFALMRDGQFLFGAVNVVLSILMCLAATFVGTVIAKLF